MKTRKLTSEDLVPGTEFFAFDCRDGVYVPFAKKKIVDVHDGFVVHETVTVLDSLRNRKSTGAVKTAHMLRSKYYRIEVPAHAEPEPTFDPLSDNAQIISLLRSIDATLKQILAVRTF